MRSPPSTRPCAISSRGCPPSHGPTRSTRAPDGPGTSSSGRRAPSCSATRPRSSSRSRTTSHGWSTPPIAGASSGRTRSPIERVCGMTSTASSIATVRSGGSTAWVAGLRRPAGNRPRGTGSRSTSPRATHPKNRYQPTSRRPGGTAGLRDEPRCYAGGVSTLARSGRNCQRRSGMTTEPSACWLFSKIAIASGRSPWPFR